MAVVRTRAAAHLLAATRLTPKATFWTRDRRQAAAAEKLALAARLFHWCTGCDRVDLEYDQACLFHLIDLPPFGFAYPAVIALRN